MQKVRSFLMIGVGLSVVLWCVDDSFAESVCRADVSYSWVKTSSTDSVLDSDVEVAAATKVPVTPTSPVKSPPNLHTVHFNSIERTAKTEEVARTLLEGDIQRQKAKASERCRRAHESFGDCISTKLSTKGMVLNSLSFSARSQVEKALLDECRLSQGECQAVTASEPSCLTIGKEKVKDTSQQDSGDKSEDSSSGSGDSVDKSEEKDSAKTASSAEKK